MTNENDKSEIEQRLDEQIEHDNEIADQLFNALMTNLNQHETDPSGILYALYINLIHALVHCGFDAEGLKRDVDWHVKNEEPWARSTYHPKGGNA